MKDDTQAFPCPLVFSPECGTMPGNMGMSLRDYFAACALPQVIRKLKIHQDLHGEYGHIAYAIADNMLAERAKTLPPATS